jgi:DNA-binding SARP family transcriptional activator
VFLLELRPSLRACAPTLVAARKRVAKTPRRVWPYIDAMSSLAIRAFGEFSLHREDADVPLTPTLRTLLAILVLQRHHGVSVESVSDALYRGRPPKTADAALRVHLAKLRDALEPTRDHGMSTRLATSGRWRIRVEDEELDVATFESRIAEGRALRRAGHHQEGDDLTEAGLALWVGRPFDLLDSPESIAERTRLARARRDAVLDLADSFLTRGEPQRAHALTDPLRAEDPFDDGILRPWVVSLAHVHGPERGLRELRLHARALREELGLDPSPALLELQRQLLTHDPSVLGPRLGEPPTASSHTPAHQPPPSRQRPAGRVELVGRETLLAEIDKVIGEGRSAVLIGEAGIGKTRILEDLAARRRAVYVSAATRPTPYGTALAVIEACLAPDDLRGKDLCVRLQGLSSHATPQPDDEQLAHLLGQALMELVLPASLILIDDSEQVDSESARALALVRAPGTIVVRAQRPIVGSCPVERLDTGARRITIPPLTRDQARILAARLAPHGEVDEATLAATGGVPLLIEYAVRYRYGIENLAARVMEGAHTSATDALEKLSVVGGPLPLGTAVDWLGLGVVEELLVRQLAEAADGTIRVRHTLLSEAVRASLRPMHHGAAAAAVLGEPVLADVSPLLFEDMVQRCGDLLAKSVVVDWKLRAAQAALNAGGTTTAARLFQDLRHNTALLSTTCEPTLGLARSWSAEGRLDDSRPLLVEAMQWMRERGDDVGVCAALRDYVGMLAPSTADGWVVDSHVRWLLRRGALDASSTVDLLDTWVASGATTDELANRVGLLTQACDGEGSPRSRLVSLGGQWRALFYSGAPAAARLALSEPAVALAEQVNDVPLLVRSLRNYIDDLVASAQRDLAGRSTARLREVGTTSGSGQARWWADLLDIARQLREGDPAEAMAAATAAHARWDRMPSSLRDDALRQHLFVGMFELGELSSLLAALDATPSTPSSAGVEDIVSIAAVALRARLGHSIVAETHSAIEAVLAAPPRGRRPAVLYLAARAAVDVRVALPELRIALAPYARSWVLLGTAMATLGPMSAVYAGLWKLEGKCEEAELWAARALAQCDRMHSPWWRSDTLTLLRS